MVSRGRLIAPLAALGCTASLLAGCASAGADMDSVTFGAGNAMHHNRIVHTVDPWPRYAWQVDLQTNADRSPLLRDRDQATGGASQPPPAGDEAEAMAN